MKFVIIAIFVANAHTVTPTIQVQQGSYQHDSIESCEASATKMLHALNLVAADNQVSIVTCRGVNGS